ncbi:hypothetical protein L2E82_10087 [Cichorium intybus]|uniref:Uncharacterized protein n=1 Tax=Cichorium intybus TaxID=13427 RepID=A0ACB9GA88_CICIN|nr:hypothetical protein L2E82_10087 [Cichorium intybus]
MDRFFMDCCRRKRHPHACVCLGCASQKTGPGDGVLEGVVGSGLGEPSDDGRAPVKEEGIGEVAGCSLTVEDGGSRSEEHYQKERFGLGRRLLLDLEETRCGAGLNSASRSRPAGKEAAVVEV